MLGKPDVIAFTSVIQRRFAIHVDSVPSRKLGLARTRPLWAFVPMVPSERELVSFYRPSIVTFLYLYAFQRYCRFCSLACHFFPTPPLVSPKFPHVPLGIGGSPFGYKERRCWANCPWNYFPRFPTYVLTIHQRHVTDRRTDGRHAIARPRFALKCIARYIVKYKGSYTQIRACGQCC